MLPAPVAAWAFNENTGTTAADTSGNGRTATLVNATWQAAGRFGSALINDGADRAASFDPLTLGTTYSIAAWIKTISTGIIIGGDAGSYGFYLADSIYHSAGLGNFVSASLPTSIADGGWHHLVVTRSDTTVRIYHNGVLVDTAQTLGANTALTLTTIGGNTDTSANAYGGQLDDLLAFDAALSDEDVADLFEAGALVAYWPFNDTPSSSATDVAGGHTATLRASGAWTTGKFGASALSNLAGSGAAASFSPINLGRDYTIAAWISGWDGSTGGVLVGGAGGFYGCYLDDSALYHSVGSGNFVMQTHGGGLTSGWHHLAIVRAGVTVSFYKDGALLGTGTFSSADQTLSAIAGYEDDSFPFIGIVDDLRFYTVGLSAARVAALYALDPDAGAGEQAVSTATISSGATLSAPTLAATVTTPTLTSTAILNPGFVALGVTAPTIASTAAITAPGTTQVVTLPTIASTATLPTISVAAAGTLSTGTILSGTVLTPPLVVVDTGGVIEPPTIYVTGRPLQRPPRPRPRPIPTPVPVQRVGLPHIGRTTTLAAPWVSTALPPVVAIPAQAAAVPTIASATTLHAPSVSSEQQRDVCPDCHGSGLKPERWMSDPQGQEPCPTCTPVVRSPRLPVPVVNPATSPEVVPLTRALRRAEYALACALAAPLPAVVVRPRRRRRALSPQPVADPAALMALDDWMVLHEH